MIKVLAGVLGLLLLLNVTITPEKIAKQIDGNLRSHLGQVGSLQVKVEGPRGIRAMNGHLKKVEIQLSRFDPAKLDLEKILGKKQSPVGAASREATAPQKAPLHQEELAKIDSVLIDARDFKFSELDILQLQLTLTGVEYNLTKALQTKQLVLTKVDKIQAQVFVKEEALSKALAPRLPDIQKASIKLMDGLVSVSGQKTMIMVPISFELTGRLQVMNKNEIHLVEPHLKIGPVPIPGRIVDKLLQDMNPLVRLNPETTHLPFDLQLVSVNVKDHLLEANALVNW